MVKRRLIVTAAAVMSVIAMLVVNIVVDGMAATTRGKFGLAMAHVELPVLANVGLSVAGKGGYSSEREHIKADAEIEVGIEVVQIGIEAAERLQYVRVYDYARRTGGLYATVREHSRVISKNVHLRMRRVVASKGDPEIRDAAASRIK